MLSDRRTWGSGIARGFSLPEMVVVVGILSIIASLAVVAFRNSFLASRSSGAQTQLNVLNQAVLKFNQVNWELTLTPDSGSSDELAIARSLQYRTNDMAGSPYLSAGLNLPVSSDTTTYRATWNGRMFEMVSTGTTGTGLELLKISESGTAYAFPNGYTPVGAP